MFPLPKGFGKMDPVLAARLMSLAERFDRLLGQVETMLQLKLYGSISAGQNQNPLAGLGQLLGGLRGKSSGESSGDRGSQA